MRDIDTKLYETDTGSVKVRPGPWHIATISLEDGKVRVRYERQDTGQEGIDEFRNAHPSNILTFIDPGDYLVNQHTGERPGISTFLLFDFQPDLLKSFGKLVDACQTERSIAKIRRLDAAMKRRDGLSVLSGGLLLEILVWVVYRAKNWALLEGLIDSGPPYQGREPNPRIKAQQVEKGAHTLSSALNWDRRISGQPSWMVLAKMFRHGWIEPQRHHMDSVFRMFKPGHDNSGADPAGEPEAKAIFDALAPTSKKLLQLLKRSPGGLPDISLLFWLESGLQSTAPISLLRHIATIVPLGRIKLAAQLMHAAVGARTLEYRGEAGLRELLAFLVDEQGLDVDATAECSHYKFNGNMGARPAHSALHAASQDGNVVALGFLLERGAKIVKDADGLTPAQRAAKLGQQEGVRFWDEYLGGKDLALDYVDGDESQGGA